MLLSVPFVLPALKQVRDFPARRELVADTVGVDLLELRRVLCGEHNIAGVNDLPYAPRGSWRLWAVDKAGGHSDLARQQCRVSQGVFSWLIFQ
ncbi:MAG: hypothetical protein E6I97_27650, partial [Chloroflexi bacterium]